MTDLTFISFKFFAPFLNAFFTSAWKYFVLSVAEFLSISAISLICCCLFIFLLPLSLFRIVATLVFLYLVCCRFCYFTFAIFDNKFAVLLIGKIGYIRRFSVVFWLIYQNKPFLAFKVFYTPRFFQQFQFAVSISFPFAIENSSVIFNLFVSVLSLLFFRWRLTVLFQIFKRFFRIALKSGAIFVQITRIM